MAVHKVNIDVVDQTSTNPIAVICVPQPCKNYAATAYEVKQLIQIAKYYVYEAGTNKIINGRNYYDYFPEEQPGGGGGGSGDSYTKAETDALLAEKTDETEFDDVTASLIDRGAKNFAPINSGSGDSQYYIVPQGTPITPGNYVVTFKASGYSFLSRVNYAVKNIQGDIIMSGKSLMRASMVDRFTAPANSDSIEITIDNGSVSDFMMCTAADYDKSQAYIPHGMTNAELTAKEQANENDISTIQQTIGNINTVLEEVL